jgi:hypothetical protein
MKILPEMFKSMCSSIGIHPQFLKVAFAFGRRTSSADKGSMPFYRSLSFEEGSKSQPSSYGRYHHLTLGYN